MNYSENSTVDERVQSYLEAGDERKAEALALLIGYLENCHSWEIKLSADDGKD